MDHLGFVLRAPTGTALELFVTPTSEHYVVGHHGIARCIEHEISTDGGEHDLLVRAHDAPATFNQAICT